MDDFLIAMASNLELTVIGPARGNGGVDHRERR